MLTRNGVGKPTEDIDWKFDETNSQISQRSKTEATWAQTTQYRPAKFDYNFLLFNYNQYTQTNVDLGLLRNVGYTLEIEK